VGFEAVPESRKFAAQFRVVINLTVEDDYVIAVLGADWLLAALEVDDL
jgi:hypothetical protein